MKRKFFLRTLGCKLNQADSAALRALLVAEGLEETASAGLADVIAVNTCSVTGRAERRARQEIRKLKRSAPRSRLYVTGCYVERSRALLASMPEVDGVYGLSERGGLASCAAGRPAGRLKIPDETFDAKADFGPRTRAFLKIQEGCDRACSYCIVRLLRGASRSLPAAQVIERLAGLAERGYHEVVLTGTHIGLWGREEGTDLSGLLRILASRQSLPRIRLCSLEPYEVSEELLELIASSPRVARHLHLAVQSGSVAVLEAMRRPPEPDRIRKIALRARELMPACSIGADVIVGFPGETEEDYIETCGLLTGAPFTYAHVFAFSPRPGTEAEQMSGRIRPDIIRARSRRLREAMAASNLSFRRSMIGTEIPALILSDNDESGRPIALTDNYLHVSVDNPVCCEANSPCRILILSATETGTTGRILDPR